MTTTKQVYRFTFRDHVRHEDVRAALVLALFGVESLYGQSRIRLDAAHYFDTAKLVCVVDAGTDVGVDLSRLFTGFLIRDLGEDGFRVERIVQNGSTNSTPSKAGFNGATKSGGTA